MLVCLLYYYRYNDYTYYFLHHTLYNPKKYKLNKPQEINLEAFNKNWRRPTLP